MLFLQQQPVTDANGMHAPDSPLGCDTASKGDQWAAQQLAVDGEEVVGKVRLPQYLLLARILLTSRVGNHAQVYRESLVHMCHCLLPPTPEKAT